MLIGGSVGSAAEPRPVTDPLTGTRPPAWWHGDEHASRSSTAALLTMRRGR